MHRSQFRRIAVAAAAVLAATASFAMASPAGEPAEGKEPVRRVVVHKAGPGAGHDVLIHHPEGAFLLGRGTMLGVAFVPLTPELRQHFGAPADAGVLVSRVIADSAAEAAGIEVGDILIEVDGKSVGDAELGRLIHGRKAGDVLSIGLLRDGRQQTVSATLKETQVSEMFEKKVLALHCKDADGEDKPCPDPVNLQALACDGEVCEVKVLCKDAGNCTCTVNGEEKPCPEGIGTK